MNLIVYNILYMLTKLSLPMFFSDIVVIGKSMVPKKGPIIIIGNHPNMIMDALLIACTCGRPVSFWAKATIFKGLSGVIARAAGAVPVIRKVDSAVVPQEGHMDNSKLQEESFASFYEGRAICVFPEGTSHSESHILHLKDGISWTQFEFYDKTDGKIEVPIVPCGITYINKHRWRSPVVLHFGKPVLLSRARLEEYRKNPKQEVKRFTSELEQLLSQLTLNTPDWETLKLAHAARRIYMGESKLGLAAYVEVTRRFSDFYSKAKDKEEVQQLKNELAAYQERLDKLHLKDYHVRDKATLGSAMRQVFDRIFFLLILLPLALPGFVLNWPVILIGKFMNFVTPYQESKATLKLLTSLVVVCIVYSLASLLLAYFSGISFWICVIVIALFGFVHMRILEEEVIGIKSIVSSLRLVSVIIRNTQRQELKSLKATRSELEQKITAMVEKYATPEQRTLDNVQGETTMGAPKKLVPRLIRRNSFSETFL